MAGPYTPHHMLNTVPASAIPPSVRARKARPLGRAGYSGDRGRRSARSSRGPPACRSAAPYTTGISSGLVPQRIAAAHHRNMRKVISRRRRRREPFERAGLPGFGPAITGFFKLVRSHSPGTECLQSPITRLRMSPACSANPNPSQAVYVYTRRGIPSGRADASEKK